MKQPEIHSAELKIYNFFAKSPKHNSFLSLIYQVNIIKAAEIKNKKSESF